MSGYFVLRAPVVLCGHRNKNECRQYNLYCMYCRRQLILQGQCVFTDFGSPQGILSSSKMRIDSCNKCMEY